MVVITSLIVASVVEKTVKYLSEKGSDYLVEKGFNFIIDSFKHDKSDFEKKLLDVINNTISQYETANPLYDDSIPFYSSEIILNELLKYRFTGDIDSISIQKLIEEGGNVNFPDKNEIENFLKLFTENANRDEKLKNLNLKINTDEEIFTISREIKKGFETIRIELQELKREIRGKGSQELVHDWFIQIDEINKNIQDFKPHTALERVKSLQQRFQDAGILNNTLEAKMSFLTGKCYAELSGAAIKEISAELFIKAHKKLPGNNTYKENAALSYCSLKQFDKAEDLANEILIYDEFNILAWLVKDIVQGPKSIEYQNQVPNLVSENKAYQLNYVHWLIASRNIETLKDIESFNYNFLDINPDAPKEINHNNRTYWSMWIKILMMKYYENNQLQTTHAINKNVPEIEVLKHINNLLGKIVAATRNTELEESNKEFEFEYYYTTFLIDGTTNKIIELEKAYSEIKKPSPINTLQLASAYNSDDAHIRKSIELLNNYTGPKIATFYLYNIMSYRSLNDIDNARKTFKELLNYISNNGSREIEGTDLYNLIQYFDNVLKNKTTETKEDFDYVVTNNRFQNQEFKELLELYISAGNNLFKEIDIEKRFEKLIESKITQYGYIKDAISVSLMRWKLYNEAVRYIKGYIDLENFSKTHEIYCDALYRGEGNKPELLTLLKKLRLKGTTSYFLLKMEVDLNAKLNDWNSVLEICEFALTIYASSNEFAYFYLAACERIHDINKIIEFIPKIKAYNFNSDYALNVSGIMYKAGQYNAAINYLYDIASNKLNKRARQEYLGMMFSSPEDVFPNPVTVDVDTYVEYTIDNKKYDAYLTEENISDDNYSKLRGKTVLETFAVGSLSKGDLTFGRIDAIRNKYTFLLKEIMHERQDPLSENHIKSFTIEGEGPEALRASMIKAVGIEGTMRQEHIKSVLDDFYSGKLPFAFAAYGLFKDDLFEAYFALTDKGTSYFRTIPSYLIKGVQNDDCKYVLDITSVLFLYQLSKKTNIQYDQKFIISSYVQTMLLTKSLDVENSTKPKMSANVTLDNMHVTLYPDNYHELQVDLYKDIDKWVKENCIVEHAEESLDILIKDEREFIHSQITLYLNETSLLASRNNYMLVTLDTSYLHFFREKLNQMSIDEYFKLKHPSNFLEAREFMLEKRLVGITIDFDLLKSEYERKLTNQPNNFSLCLENLKMIWNPNPEHLASVVSFLRWVYMLPYILDAEKSRTSNFAFMNLVQGISKPLLSVLLVEIKDKFRLLPIHEVAIMQELAIVIQTLT